MALKPCKKCGEKTTTYVDTCRHCGAKDPTTDKRKQQKGHGFGYFIFVVIVGLVVLYALLNTPSEDGRKIEPPQKAEEQDGLPDHVLMARAIEYMKLTVFDPDALQIRDLFVNDGTACGWYNGKNIVGAYVGWQRFIYDEDTAKAAMLLGLAIGGEAAKSELAEVLSDKGRLAELAISKEENEPEFSSLWVSRCQ